MHKQDGQITLGLGSRRECNHSDCSSFCKYNGLDYLRRALDRLEAEKLREPRQRSDFPRY